MVQGSRFLALFIVPLALVAAPLAVAGCIQVGTDVADTDPSGAAGSDDASSASGASGTGCSQDPTTGITLCTGLSECSSIAIDQSALAGCGFRVHAGSALIDLECLCGTDLCPIGVPDTCAQASALLSGLTSLVVCEQDSEGKCVQEEAAEAGTSTGSGTTSTTSTCNNQCLVSCGAAPDCQQLCGC